MQIETRLPFREALRRIPSEGSPFATLIEQSGLTVELYAPREVDEQEPHARDEIYIVARGGGELVLNGRRMPCAVNDLLFVAAHAPHRFEGFTDDFAVWVIFFGEEKTKASSR